MTSPTGTVLGVTNVTGMFDKGPNRCVLPGALAAGINHLIERTENERECQNACPGVGLSPRLLAKSAGRLAVYLIVCSHTGVARRGLRAQVRQKIWAYPVLPRSIACLAFKKDHRPTRSVTGPTRRADQSRAAIGTRIAGSSFTRHRHLVTPMFVHPLASRTTSVTGV